MGVSKILEIVFIAADKAIQLYEKRKARLREWSNKKDTVRGCPKCKEISFTPGETVCSKCGAVL